MKFYGHDAFRTFDYVAVVNRVFDLMVMNDLDMAGLAQQAGVSYGVVSSFLRYEVVSMPTLLLLCEWACINLAYYVIEQD